MLSMVISQFEQTSLIVGYKWPLAIHNNTDQVLHKQHGYLQQHNQRIQSRCGPKILTGSKQLHKIIPHCSSKRIAQQCSKIFLGNLLIYIPAFGHALHQKPNPNTIVSTQRIFLIVVNVSTLRFQHITNEEFSISLLAILLFSLYHQYQKPYSSISWKWNKPERPHEN